MREFKELNKHELEALESAMSALYFNDSHDFRTALWDVVNALLNIRPADEDGFDLKQAVHDLDREGV